MEDDAKKMLRVLQEDRQLIAERIIAGTVSADNVANGYRYLTGVLAGYDAAIARLYEVFQVWLPDAPKFKEQAKRPMGDY
jgi:hypothetical protein